MTTSRPTHMRATMQGLALGLVLFWLLAVPLCPAQLAQILPSGGAVPFIGALMLGCALFCVLIFALNARGVRAERLAAVQTCASCLVPFGASALVLGLSADLAHASAWVIAGSMAIGLGLGAMLLTWGATLSVPTTSQQLSILGVACACAGLLAAVCCMLAGIPSAVRVMLALLALLTMVATFLVCPEGESAPSKEGSLTPRASNEPLAQATEHAASPGDAGSVRTLFAHFWEPVLGLGLSLMSAVLPWGSFIEGDTVSTPVFWSFVLGLLVAGAMALVAAHAAPGRIDFDTAIHVAVPLLAAAVVGLRLVGDLDETGEIAFFAKGIGSGVTSAGFLMCAWLAMAREAKGLSPQRAQVPFALGFGCACLIGFVILPFHAANQMAAALTAPFLSLAFLAASCCNSIVHLRHRAEARQTAPAPLTIEAAADTLARAHGLSPRETEVLHQLVLGRSAESIGSVLGISPNTVRSHVGNIHSKLDIQSRDQLADLIEQVRQAPLTETDKL